MEDKLDKIIQKEIKKLVKESTLTKTLTSVKPIVIHKTVGETAINEMARINKNENGKCIFPYDKFEVKMWSFDHNPPHFHVICEAWNISYKVEDGSLLNIVKKGKDNSIFDYINSNVKDWLSSKCFAQPKLTNMENAILQWQQIHDD